MSSVGHYADLSMHGDGCHIIERDLGIQTAEGEADPSTVPRSSEITLSLKVPENPTPTDLIRAYYDQIRRQAEIAAEAVLDAELNAANAERIAQAARFKALRLADQAWQLRVQLESIDRLNQQA